MFNFALYFLEMTKKDKILFAAKNLFLEKGYKGTNVRQIAKAAEVNIAMISYYFGSKEQLLQEIMEIRIKDLSFELNELSHDEEIEPFEKMALIIQVFIERVFANVKVAAIFHREIAVMEKASLKTRMVNSFIKNANNIKSIIVEGQEKKVFRKDIDIDLTIFTIISTIIQFAQSRYYTKEILKIDIINIDEKKKIILIDRLQKHMMDYVNNNLKIHA